MTGGWALQSEHAPQNTVNLLQDIPRRTLRRMLNVLP